MNVARRSLLAVPVAALALLSLAVGAWLGDAGVVGLAAVGALLAVTTFRAAGISTFLRIFATVFAVEYVVFGLVFLAGRGGLWPAAFADLVPPSSLPVTVGIFGILVYLISFIPVIRTITRIADPFFESDAVRDVRLWPFGIFRMMERRFATAVLVSLVLINQAQVAINVRLSFFNRDWFNAIQNKDAAAFWSLLLTVFLFWATIFVVSAIVEYVIQSLLTIRWRRWLTDHYVGAWLGGSAHYRMALTGDRRRQPRPAHRGGHRPVHHPDLRLLRHAALAGQHAGLVLDHPVGDLGELHDPRHGDRRVPASCSGWRSATRFSAPRSRT